MRFLGRAGFTRELDRSVGQSSVRQLLITFRSSYCTKHRGVAAYSRVPSANSQDDGLQVADLTHDAQRSWPQVSQSPPAPLVRPAPEVLSFIAGDRSASLRVLGRTNAVNILKHAQLGAERDWRGSFGVPTKSDRFYRVAKNWTLDPPPRRGGTARR